MGLAWNPVEGYTIGGVPAFYIAVGLLVSIAMVVMCVSHQRQRPTGRRGAPATWQRQLAVPAPARPCQG